MTGTDVITLRARPALGDTDAGAYQFDTLTLINWLNDGGRLITVLKPDSLLTAPYTMTTWTDITALTQTITLNNRFMGALVDYVCARALGQDGHDKRDLERSKEYYKQFVAKAGLPPQVAMYT